MSPATYAQEVPRDPTRPWAPSPFRRLARTHACSVAGDAIFTTTIAGLVFFNVSDLNQARWQVALALIFTFVPFTLAAPFIGPLIDRARGGRKWMIVALCGLRAAVCFALILTRSNAVALYPLFLVMLVLAKGYVIARGTIVPTTVRSDAELVEANSKLSAISGFAAVAGGGPSLLVMKIFGDAGPDVALGLAGVVFVAGTVLATQLPAARTAALPPDVTEEVELEGEGIRHAARGVAFARGVVGFLTFLLAFYFKDIEGNEGLVGIGVSVVGAQAGFMIGAWAAPRARKVVSEERMLMAALGIIAVTGVLTALMGAIAGAALLSFGVGFASNAAKQAFDALVQRDAPDANRGRAFARFETRFQLIWVVGALVPVAISIPIQAGFTLIAIGSIVSLVVYSVALRRAVAAARRRPSPLAGEPELVEPRPPSRSFLRGRRADRARRRDEAGGRPYDPAHPDADGDGIHDATGFAIDPTLDPDATRHADPAPADARVQGLDAGDDPTTVAAVAAPRWGAGAADPPTVAPTGGSPPPAAPPDARWAPAQPPVTVTPAGAPPVDGDAVTAPGYAPVTDAPAGGTAAPAAAPAAGGPASGLFADISDHGFDHHGDVPTEGLFAVPPVSAAGGSAAPPGPVLYDASEWLHEDDPTGPRPAPDRPDGEVVAVPTAGGSRAPDPGPPSLVPPAPEPGPRVEPAGVRPAWTDPGPGDSGEFYGAPSEAAVYRPPPAAPPPPVPSSRLASPAGGPPAPGAPAPAPASPPYAGAPSVGAEADASGAPVEPADPAIDLYQDPPWRDATTPHLPGFEPEDRTG